MALPQQPSTEWALPCPGPVLAWGAQELELRYGIPQDAVLGELLLSFCGPQIPLRTGQS